MSRLRTIHGHAVRAPRVRRRAWMALQRWLEYSPQPIRRAALHASRSLPYHLRLPHFLVIEPHNRCNLHCPLCPVGNGDMKRSRQSMSLERFQALVDEVKPFVRSAILAGAGEPAFHKHCFDMVRYAELNGIRIVLETNGTVDHADPILASGLSEVLFALDGLSPESYEQYRIGASFERTLANLERLCRLKRDRGLTHPRVNLQFVVMRENEGDIPELLALAKRFGVDQVTLKTLAVNGSFHPSQEELRERYLPRDLRLTRYVERDGTLIPDRPLLCGWLWGSCVQANGDVSMCCYDFESDHIAGNVFRDGGFVAVYRSARYREMRRGIVEKRHALCRECVYSLRSSIPIDMDS